jgi:hypothetical protein
VAQRVEVVLVDDLDGGPADETVQFALDGVSYEIDLTEQNAQALRDAIATWVGHARRVRTPLGRVADRPDPCLGEGAGASRQRPRTYSCRHRRPVRGGARLSPHA